MTGKFVSDSYPPPPGTIFVLTYRFFQLPSNGMADNVEQVEAESVTGEMWLDKKVTLLAVVKAN